YANLTWCTFGMSSSLKSLHELAEEFKWKRTKGELVRYIDIAVPTPEEGGIFDNLSGPAHTHAAASSELVGKLKASTASYYGTAMPAFIDMLLKEDRSAEVVKLTDKFVRKVQAKKGWDQRLARKFGIAYAAGKLAVKAGILPWPEDWVFRAVVRCYRRALAGMAKHADVLNSKLHAVKIASTAPVQFPVAKSGAKPKPPTFLAPLGATAPVFPSKVQGELAGPGPGLAHAVADPRRSFPCPDTRSCTSSAKPPVHSLMSDDDIDSAVRGLS